MAYRLSFAASHSYAANDTSITLPVSLRSNGTIVDLVASLDTGASHCLFEGAYASALGLELTDGLRLRFRTANSSFEAYGHEIEVNVLNVSTLTMVYFFADPGIVKNVLGRSGWLDRVRLGIVDYDRALYLSAYDQDL